VAQPSVRRPQRRRPGRWQSVLGILLILAVVLVVADRAAAAVAADQLKTRVAGELAAREVSYSSLDVAVAGTPFLTQVAQSRFESISIDMTDVRLRSGEIEATLPAFDIDATGVRADALAVARGDASVTAEQVVGSAVVSYAGLGGLIDLSDYFVRDVVFTERAGALYATATVSVVSLELPIEVGADVSLQDGQIQLRFRDVVASGMSVPDIALPAVDALVNAVIVANMPPLPFGITLDALSVAPEGLAITATGREVTLVTG
jgi:hypothetical protein